MNNISTYTFGKKLFISIDLSKNSGKTQSGKSINVATSRGYCPLSMDSSLRLKLHLYQLAKHSPVGGMTEPEDATNTNNPDFNQLLAVASGLTNEARKTLIHELKQMIVRDSVN
jgi:hypothetical protein